MQSYEINTADVSRLERSYYESASYISKTRMLTYWYQIRHILCLRPESLLEVGIGNGLIRSFFGNLGVDVKTLDINASLKPDYVGSILSPPRDLQAERYDVVLCSRVLHHVPFADFGTALEQLASLSPRHCILTLPVDDFRIYWMLRITSTSIYTIHLPLPKRLKRLAGLFKSGGIGSGLWQIGSSAETQKREVVRKIQEHFRIKECFEIPEDCSHMFFALEPKSS